MIVLEENKKGQSINDLRKKENLEPIEGGDKILISIEDAFYDVFNDFDNLILCLYSKLKNESSTYGELKHRIYQFNNTFTWNKKSKENSEYLRVIVDKMLEFFNEEVSKKTID